MYRAGVVPARFTPGSSWRGLRAGSGKAEHAGTRSSMADAAPVVSGHGVAPSRVVNQRAASWLPLTSRAMVDSASPPHDQARCNVRHAAVE